MAACIAVSSGDGAGLCPEDAAKPWRRGSCDRTGSRGCKCLDSRRGCLGLPLVQHAGTFGDGRGLHRLETPSLRRMLLTCTLAVLGLMYSSAAIWALVRPAARMP